MNQSPKPLKRMLVVGAGFMGHGVAQGCAQSGVSVILIDPEEEALARAHVRCIEKRL
jgi:3-hydroxyacyl-CoA dehydrogenase